MFTVIVAKNASVPPLAGTALSLLNRYQDDDDGEGEEGGEVGQGMTEASAEPTTLPPSTTTDTDILASEADATGTTTDTDAIVCETDEPVAEILPVHVNELPVESSVDMNQELDSALAAVDECVTIAATATDVGQSEPLSLVESAVSDAVTPQLALTGHNYEEQLETIPGECGLSLLCYFVDVNASSY